MLSPWAVGAVNQPQIVRVGIYANPPKIYLNDQGQADGILVDVLRKLAEEEGWQLEFVSCEWERCLRGLEQGELDLLPDVAWSEARSRTLDFHRTPALHSWSQVYRRANVPIVSMLDLRGKRVAVLGGSIQHAFFEEFARNFGVAPVIVPVTSVDEAFTLVERGQAEALVASNYAAAVHGLDPDVVETPLMFQPARLFFATGKGRNAPLLAAIDRRLEPWQRDPQSVYFEILEKWRVHGTRTRIPAYVWWAAAALTGLLAIATLLAVLMRRQVRRKTGALRDSEQRMATILDTVDSLIYIKDANYRYAYANRALCEFFGRKNADIIGKRDTDMFEAPVAAALRDNDAQAMQGGTRVVAEEFVLDAHGRQITVLSTKVPLCRTDGSVYGLCGISIDISARRMAEESNRVAATVFQSEEGMMVVRPDCLIQKVNHAFVVMTGFTEEELAGHPVPWFALQNDGADARQTVWDLVERTGKWQGEIWSRRKAGELYPAWMTITAVRDEHGRTTNYVGTLGDITQQKLAQDEILHLAYYDTLTGLPNRRLLLERLGHCLQKRSPPTLALLFLDLDNFKDLNDSRGHETGDELLKQVGQRISACTREGDTVARLGGDEFVILLDNVGADADTAAEHAARIGSKILAEVDKPFVIGGITHHTTCSIGAALRSEHDVEVEDLMRHGDLAMYEAKKEGRNTMRFFHQEMLADVTYRLALETELRASLSKSEFLLHYQPQVDGEGRMVGAEALLRWNHAKRGIVGPNTFVSIAEKSGLIVPLGRWVLRTACTQLAQWGSMPGLAHLTIAVNVSVREFRHAQFVAETLAILRETGANPARLKLELTESVLIENAGAAIEKMHELKVHGIRFALDDFGTGYSSLSYLKLLPLDQLKIDRSFVRDVLVDPDDAAIARSIVALAKALGLGIIAEGVETESQRAFLLGIGCDCAQGYLFGRPMEVAALERMLGAEVQ
ncbi:MAG TPA: EAL domain-containing protein [Telluria sp.]